jgi:hypothetical protein
VAGLPADDPRKSRQGRWACRLRKHMNIENVQSESGDWSAKRHRTTPDRRRRRREISGCRKRGDGSTDTLGETAAREGRRGGTTMASANTRKITVTCDLQTCARTKRVQGCPPSIGRATVRVLSSRRFGGSHATVIQSALGDAAVVPPLCPSRAAASPRVSVEASPGFPHPDVTRQCRIRSGIDRCLFTDQFLDSLRGP